MHMHYIYLNNSLQKKLSYAHHKHIRKHINSIKRIMINEHRTNLLKNPLRHHVLVRVACVELYKYIELYSYITFIHTSVVCNF